MRKIVASLNKGFVSLILIPTYFVVMGVGKVFYLFFKSENNKIASGKESYSSPY